MNDSCANCKFYDPYDDNPKQGMCRRYPPQVSEGVYSNSNDDGLYEVSSVTSNLFPEVSNNSWCGEFKEKTP